LDAHTPIIDRGPADLKTSRGRCPTPFRRT